MKIFIKYLTLLLLLTSLLSSAPSRGGVLTFAQPDGTTFKGILRGSSTFNWIESKGKIVMINEKDGFFYNASFTKEGELTPTQQKPESSSKSDINFSQKATQYKKKSEHKIDEVSSEKLQKLYKKSRKGHHPQ